MKRKIIVITFVLIVIIASFFVWQSQTSSPTDAEIRAKFNCDRLTREARSTDYYCSNPDAYREGELVPEGYLGI